MKLARCEYKGKTYHGILREEAVHIIDRSPYGDYEETETRFDLIEFGGRIRGTPYLILGAAECQSGERVQCLLLAHV